MRLCNDTITVFNKRYDADAGDYIYLPTTITGVSWYATQAEAVDPKGGLVAASKITIRIPASANAGGKTYADPLTYKAATSASGLWTLQGGDIIIKGTAEGTTWTQKTLEATFPDICKVLGVTDNRRAPNAPHFKVVGA